MNFDDLSSAVRNLSYRDKLRLAQLLMELARSEEREAGPGASGETPVTDELRRTGPAAERAGAAGRTIDPDRPWVGRDYPQRRVFVLGESYTGKYEDDLEYDDAYMAALLDGRKVPGPELFIRMAEKLQMPLATLWHQVAFTNMALGSLGATNATKVTAAQLRAGRPRLEALLRRLEPKAVLILGARTSDAAAPVCERLGLPYRSVYHPTGVNNANPRTACTAEMLQSAWRACVEMP